MNNALLNILRLTAILAAISGTIYAAHSNLRTLAFVICGLIFKDFFSSNVYDPLFKDQSAQSWAFGKLKKWTTRKQPTSKLDF